MLPELRKFTCIFTAHTLWTGHFAEGTIGSLFSKFIGHGTCRPIFVGEKLVVWPHFAQRWTGFYRNELDLQREAGRLY